MRILILDIESNSTLQSKAPVPHADFWQMMGMGYVSWQNQTTTEQQHYVKLVLATNCNCNGLHLQLSAAIHHSSVERMF